MLVRSSTLRRLDPNVVHMTVDPPLNDVVVGGVEGAVLLFALVAACCFCMCGCRWFCVAKKKAKAAQYQMISKALEAEEEEFALKINANDEGPFQIDGDHELDFDPNELEQLKVLEEYQKSLGKAVTSSKAKVADSASTEESENFGETMPKLISPREGSPKLDVEHNTSPKQEKRTESPVNVSAGAPEPVKQTTSPISRSTEAIKLPKAEKSPSLPNRPTALKLDED